VIKSDTDFDLPFLRPAPSLREVADRFWEELTQRAKDKIAGNFRGGWWAVWEDRKLRIKRQVTGPPGTGGYVGGLREPIIEFDGESINAAINDTVPLCDEVVETMVTLGSLLKEQCQQSGWNTVEVGGAPGVVKKLKDRLNRNQNAPLVYDAEIMAALERSHGDHH
jgi:hypothetical protein